MNIGRLERALHKDPLNVFMLSESGFGYEYLRQHTKHDIVKQMTINEERGFHNIFGSIDCMHWHWESCPIAHQ